MRAESQTESKDENQTVSLTDGRKLGYSIIGEGKPVLYFHGTASSRLETLLFKQLAYTNQLQIIGIDRPGYGLSTFTPRTRIQDFADDVNQLADHLSIEKFALLGWSGGGPFLLTYNALFPERVTRAVIAGSPNLPFNVATAHNNPLARYAMKFSFIGMWALKKFAAFVQEANKDIDCFLSSKAGRNFLSGWPPEDRKYFADPAWLTLMMGAMAEGFRQGNAGVKAVFQEHQLFIRNWDTLLSLVSAKNLHIWQGTEDKTCRTENAYKISKIIPSAHLEIFEGKGHCAIFDNLKKLGQILRSSQP